MSRTLPATSETAVRDVPSAVVVHAGARDFYQVAAALNEERSLQTLVTNVYSARRAKEQYGVDLPRSLVTTPARSLAAYLCMRISPGSNLNGFSDRVLGETARAVALKTGAPLFAYSYYAQYAFTEHRADGEKRFLFQLHPHPESVRRILTEERDLVPEARASLDREWELSLGPHELKRLAGESMLADHVCVASSYTRQTLTDSGLDPAKISLVPYGVNTAQFSPGNRTDPGHGPLRIVWVGSLVQRKGLSYALDAVARFSPREVNFVVCGRGFADLEIIRRHGSPNVEIKTGLDTNQIIEELRRADLFLLPSLAEGFAHSIVEAMSCGVPVITTAHTCGRDLIQEGVNGYIVPIRDADAIAQKLEDILNHRDVLDALGREARRTALTLTWDRFRKEIRAVYRSQMGAAA